MSVLIEIREGLFVNPSFVSSVVTTKTYACMFVARGNSDEAIHLDLEQWLAVKPLLVARYAARPAAPESVTAKAVSEILAEEADYLTNQDVFEDLMHEAFWEQNNAMAEKPSTELPSVTDLLQSDDFWRGLYPDADEAELVERKALANVRLAHKAEMDARAEAEDAIRVYAPDDEKPSDDDDFEDDEQAGGPLDTDLSRLIQVVKSGNFVILDTETTGLNGNAEICQIAIIDSDGNTLLDTLVRPQRPIPSDATRIHGITNDMVKAAPDWLNVNEAVWQACQGKTVVVYNAEYDFKMIAQSEKACEPLFLSDWHTVKRECAMLAYAEYRGVWNEYHGNYKWHKLSDAAARVGYSLPAGMKAHSALADCLMTLAVCRKLAGL